jgi:hypothetical protein
VMERPRERLPTTDESIAQYRTPFGR